MAQGLSSYRCYLLLLPGSNILCNPGLSKCFRARTQGPDSKLDKTDRSTCFGSLGGLLSTTGTGAEILDQDATRVCWHQYLFVTFGASRSGRLMVIYKAAQIDSLKLIPHDLWVALLSCPHTT